MDLRILELDERKINNYRLMYIDYLNSVANAESTKKEKLSVF